MSKVKQWAWDSAEKESDEIILDFCQGNISFDVAKEKLSNVANIDLCGIDEYNLDEVLDTELEIYKKKQAAV